MQEEVNNIVEEVCAKFGYDSNDRENNDSLKTVLSRVASVILKDSNQEDRKLFYQMLIHTPIIVTENLTRKGSEKFKEQYIGNINPHIIEEDTSLGEYGKKNIGQY